MEDFVYKATHFGKESAEFYAAEYMVNAEGLIIAYKLQKEGVWKEANKVKFPYQIFPSVYDLEEISED